ncbi:MAG: hypothetical protein ACTSX7_20235 [Alphaproteobacteria bacterium]
MTDQTEAEIAKEALLRAWIAGDLSIDNEDDNFLGNYVYMYSDSAGDHFKNHITQQCLVSDPPNGPAAKQRYRDATKSRLVFRVEVESFGASYAFGTWRQEVVSDDHHILHDLELDIRGTVVTGPTAVGKPASIRVTGADLEPDDKEWFKDVWRIGEMRIGSAFAVTANAPRSGVHAMLQLLNSNKKTEMWITCEPSEDGEKYDLLYLSMDIEHEPNP